VILFCDGTLCVDLRVLAVSSVDLQYRRPHGCSNINSAFHPFIVGHEPTAR
jgi:hypothetical protein